jgi:acyl carrier protein
MVPAAIVLLERFPLSSNGKIDRRALPAPDTIPESATDSFVAPRSEAEALIAEIWAEVLNAPRIGVHDNFFELGGHSLSAVQVQARLQRHLDAPFPLRQIFESPTIKGLAKRVEALAKVPADCRPGRNNGASEVVEL